MRYQQRETMKKANFSKTQTELSKRLRERKIEINLHKTRDNLAQRDFWNEFELEREQKRMHHMATQIHWKD